MKPVIALAQELIRLPSLSGQEAGVAAHARDYMAGAGFTARVDDHGTAIGVLRRGDGPTLLLDAHTDTVDVERGGWRHDPFGGEIEVGYLYGRGAADMKGALAAMLAAGAALARESWRGTLVITGTSWEERFEGYTLGVALAELAREGVRPDAVIIGEASELNVKRGQRGRTRLHFDVRGRPAHSAHPERGVNAVYHAAELIRRIRQMPLPEDDFLGRGIAELIGIGSQPQPIDSIVPYACRVSYDLRLLPGQTRASVLAQFAGIIEQLHAGDAAFQAEVSIAGGELVTSDGRVERVEPFPPAWKLEEGHPLVQRAVAALRGIGQRPAVTKYGFCTNGSYSAGEAGIPTIGYGPGAEDGAHVAEERIAVDEVERACEGYAAIARAVLAGR